MTIQEFVIDEKMIHLFLCLGLWELNIFFAVLAQDSLKPALQWPALQVPPDSTVVSPSGEQTAKEENNQEGTARPAWKDWLSIIEIDPIAPLIALISLGLVVYFARKRKLA